MEACARAQPWLVARPNSIAWRRRPSCSSSGIGPPCKTDPQLGSMGPQLTTTISRVAVSMAGMPVSPGRSLRGRLTTARRGGVR